MALEQCARIYRTAEGFDVKHAFSKKTRPGADHVSKFAGGALEPGATAARRLPSGD